MRRLVPRMRVWVRAPRRRTITIKVGDRHWRVDVRSQLGELSREVEMHGPFDGAKHRIDGQHTARHVVILIDDDPMPC